MASSLKNPKITTLSPEFRLPSLEESPSLIKDRLFTWELILLNEN